MPLVRGQKIGMMFALRFRICVRIKRELGADDPIGAKPKAALATVTGEHFVTTPLADSVREGGGMRQSREPGDLPLLSNLKRWARCPGGEQLREALPLFVARPCLPAPVGGWFACDLTQLFLFFPNTI